MRGGVPSQRGDRQPLVRLNWCATRRSSVERGQVAIGRALVGLETPSPHRFQQDRVADVSESIQARAQGPAESTSRPVVLALPRI